MYHLPIILLYKLIISITRAIERKGRIGHITLTLTSYQPNHEGYFNMHTFRMSLDTFTSHSQEAIFKWTMNFVKECKNSTDRDSISYDLLSCDHHHYHLLIVSRRNIQIVCRESDRILNIVYKHQIC